MEQHYVESPDLKERFLLGTFERVTEITCPIDSTPLVSVMEREHYAYECKCCGKNYQWGEKNPQELLEQARIHAFSLAEKHVAREYLAKDGPKLERILQLAEQKGIFNS